MAHNREQKLIDIMIQCVLTVLDPEHHEGFMKMEQEAKVAWVEKQLNGCGFKTAPGAGCTWLRLEQEG